MPFTVDYATKKKKIINGGYVAFTLLKVYNTGVDRFMIDPKSIIIVYGRFKYAYLFYMKST